ncbi:MAG: phenylalanine--tRNA ligase subunit alpha, partial [Candidatus Angelobacter sp.]
MYTVPKLKSYTATALEKASDSLLAALEKESSAVKNEEEWRAFRDRWMARKNGVLTQINDLWLKQAPKESKREVGQRVNQLKATVTATVEKPR